MKKDIHPKYYPNAKVICACGNTFTVGSTVPEIRTDVCSVCHPFFTGEQRIVDTAGQVERFQRRLDKAEGRPEKKKRHIKKQRKVERLFELVPEEGDISEGVAVEAPEAVSQPTPAEAAPAPETVEEARSVAPTPEVVAEAEVAPESKPKRTARKPATKKAVSAGKPKAERIAATTDKAKAKPKKTTAKDEKKVARQGARKTKEAGETEATEKPAAKKTATSRAKKKSTEPASTDEA
ncbi:MAG: 50S ribosomal protein L31 [Chloroflexi bacterium]|nr:50S ribosomal protein L31 [Chloroflexota bacterium]